MNLGTVNEASQLYIHSTSGDIKIKKLLADVAKIETTKGDVNIKSFGNDLDVKTSSGDIKVTFDSTEISNQIDLVSKSGEITLNLNPELACILKLFNAKGQNKTKGVNVEGFDKIETNSLVINSGTKVIRLTSNEHIEVNLI